jgi:hypothetical protein
LPDSGKGFRCCIFQVNPHECVETKPAIDRGADGFTVADVAMRWARPTPVPYVFPYAWCDCTPAPTIRSALAVLAALFDRLGRHEPAATIAGFAVSPMTAAAFPALSTAIAHLREVLGDQTYEALARKGETMATAEMVAYTYDQIDQARAELEHPR